MTEFQITYWRDLPSLVVARHGDEIVKAALATRFQEAIDEAAVRTGSLDADSSLAGWRRSDWMVAEVDPAAVCAEQVAGLERAWPPERVSGLLGAPVPAPAPASSGGTW